MKKNYSSLFSIVFLSCVVVAIYFFMMPQWVSKNESFSEFSTNRALEQIKTIAQKPHYVGSANHKVVENYLVAELQKLGLETQIQEGTTLTDWGNLVKSRNILARIKGSNNSKALLLLSHYDSAPHSISKGASDDASGVATILESVRAFLYAKTKHKNDIIILFSDAEELGLNGAALFVTQSKWTNDIGLALNFEARGTSGPSYMLMEVNKGNAAMIKAFKDADVKYPVSNSLMYSIYKMLPNDTDLTVFREQGKIQGFNFAFIDNHYNYHTVQDNFAHINPTTIEHQGCYLMPLLKHFSNTNLTNLNTAEDDVYFNTPFNFVSYPFAWVMPMVIGSFVLFLLLLFVGIGKRVLDLREIILGFIPLFGSLIMAGLVTFLGWKLLLNVYPEYNDILQGFTYNGHSYIGAFISLSLAIAFLFYTKSKSEIITYNYFIAPLLLWIGINLGIALYLPGAGFFIIPVICSLLMLGVFVTTQKSFKLLNLILSIPSLIIIFPFIHMFPIGLGLKILFGSAILTVLLFSLLLPVFGTFSKKGIWGTIMILICLGFLVEAHFNSEYQYGKAKPNSLLYVLDGDNNKAFWTTYDKNLDEWTKGYLGENPNVASELNKNNLYSKYNSQFTFSTQAPIKEISKPTILFLRDSIVDDYRYLKIKITPNRLVNRFDVFANEKMIFQNFKANNVGVIGQKGSKLLRNGKKIVSYYVVDNEPLILQFSILKKTVFDMELMESSFDLLSNAQFSIAKRKDWMIPTPFVLNDAIVIKQKIKPSPKIIEVKPVVYKPKPIFKSDSLTVQTDSINNATN